MQLQSTVRTSVSAVLQGTLATEGVRGLYRGFVPNALKNLPNKGAPQTLMLIVRTIACSVFLLALYFPWLFQISNLLCFQITGIRLSTFDAAKKLLNRSERAYKEEVANAQRWTLIHRRKTYLIDPNLTSFLSWCSRLQIVHRIYMISKCSDYEQNIPRQYHDIHCWMDNCLSSFQLADINPSSTKVVVSN